MKEQLIEINMEDHSLGEVSIDGKILMNVSEIDFCAGVKIANTLTLTIKSPKVKIIASKAFYKERS